ncbi:MAG TPA: extracellular solute-binding protein [Candidatus Acidoferrum sp.]|jgi:spermidine/putrescine transport system substrate-binding protein|nr:extracellular solute-binding protein [Candidatus Acidoferrum sp.]
MATDRWNAEINRRDFLRAGAALGIGGSALWLAAACGASSPTPVANANASPTPLHYPTAKIDGDLNLFNWSQYMDPGVIDRFGKHYGIKVNTPYFDNMEDMLTKLNAGIAYDLTFPTMDYAVNLIKAGALLPIDHTQLANWSQVPQYFNNPWYDPMAIYSAPYAIWTTGIMWRTNQVSGMTGSWNDFWLEAPTYHDKMFLLNDYQEVLGMSLLRKGFDINSGVQSQLDTAVSEVLKISTGLRGFETDDITNMVNGTAWIHHAWSGDAYQVISQVNDPQNIKYETCIEGVPTGNDTMVIPKNAQHPGTALKFIDWMLDPANATSNVAYFGYPQVTTAGISAYQNTIAKQYPFLNMTLDAAINGLREIVPTGDKRYLWIQEWRKIIYS